MEGESVGNWWTLCALVSLPWLDSQLCPSAERASVAGMTNQIGLDAWRG